MKLPEITPLDVEALLGKIHDLKEESGSDNTDIVGAQVLVANELRNLTMMFKAIALNHEEQMAKLIAEIQNLRSCLRTVNSGGY
jgi:hypothetical protein